MVEQIIRMMLAVELSKDFTGVKPLPKPPLGNPPQWLLDEIAAEQS